MSGASGAVGLAAGQLARSLGATAIGLTGGPEKVASPSRTAAFDTVLDARSDSLASQLRACCPEGVDVLFENVGGGLLEIGLAALKPNGRAAICGLASLYDEPDAQVGALPWATILMRRLRVKGFGVFDFSAEARARAQAALNKLYAQGDLDHSVDLIEGLQDAPRAFLDQLRGVGSGKAIVHIDC